MVKWRRKSPVEGSSYEEFNNDGTVVFDIVGKWFIKYEDDRGCETESTYDVIKCCECEDFSASESSVSFSSIGGSNTVTFSLAGTCSGSLTDLTCSNNGYDWITPTFNESHDTLTITVGAYSDTTTNRTGSITVSYNGNTCNNLTITVEQSQATPGECNCDYLNIEDECDCDNLSGSTTSLSFGSAGGSKTIAYKLTGTCSGSLDYLNFLDVPDWITKSYDSETGVVTFTASATESYRTVIITPEYNGRSCSGWLISVSQDDEETV